MSLPLPVGRTASAHKANLIYCVWFW